MFVHYVFVLSLLIFCGRCLRSRKSVNFTDNTTVGSPVVEATDEEFARLLQPSVALSTATQNTQSPSSKVSLEDDFMRLLKPAVINNTEQTGLEEQDPFAKYLQPSETEG